MSNNMKNALGVVEEQLANFTVGLFKKPQQQESKPSRRNLILIGLASFSMLTLLDLIAAVIVGILTNALYGLLVFAVGVGSLVISELGYFYPYAQKWQKIIAVIDGIISIGSTLLIGVLAAIVYAVEKFGIFSFGDSVFIVEVSLMSLLVLIGATHAVMWIVYVLIDRGVSMNQSHMNKVAESEMFQKGFDLAKSLVLQQIETGKQFKEMVDENKGSLLAMNLREIVGQEVEELLNNKQPARQFSKDTESPKVNPTEAGKQ
jgi:hypothetical protein